jgi:hypothetical protein
MTKSRIQPTLIALAISLTLSAGAMAQALSKDDYKAAKDRISNDYQTAKTACKALSANPKDICIARAKGVESIAAAELEASYKPSAKTRNKVRVAKAKADHAVALEQCDELTGNAKDVCVKEAKSHEVAALADAKVALTTADANATANQKSTDAYGKASTEVAGARKDAAIEKLDAQYKVEKEKCDLYAGDVKDQCLAKVKSSFGKS